MLVQWYENGADPKEWPQCQSTDTWARIIVVDQIGAKYCERQPAFVRIEDPFFAWGSGRDFALAAMYLGKSAGEAVEIACFFDAGCGKGIDVFEWRKGMTTKPKSKQKPTPLFTHSPTFIKDYGLSATTNKAVGRLKKGGKRG